MPQVRFIGLDVHKKKIAVAIAEEGRNGEVLSCGSIDNTKAALAKRAAKLVQIHLSQRGAHRPCALRCHEQSPRCLRAPWRGVLPRQDSAS
jgi:hypothetical protein